MGRRTLPPAPEGSRGCAGLSADPWQSWHTVELDDYLEELARRLGGVLGGDLLGVYAGGSYALAAYVPGRSDIDVTAVAAGPLSPAAKRAIVERLRHEALPCPARGLELVVYPLATARSGGGEPGFELNLNTGAAMGFRVDEAPGDIEGFWFAIDRAILRAHGVALSGPPAAELFAPIPRATLLALLQESIRWHRDSAVPLGSDTVLNSCRALRFATEGTWSSKRAAGAWAAQEPVVRAALAGEPLERAAVVRFLDAVLDEVARQA
jgi:hypothetical protein